MWSKRNTPPLLVGLQTSKQKLWKSSLWFLRKLDLFQDQGTYPKNVSSCHKDTCTVMFMEASFIISRIWKQPRCPSTEEKIKKILYIYSMEYFSTVKNNDTKKFAGKWMELGKIILGEVTQTEKDKHVMYLLISGY